MAGILGRASAEVVSDLRELPYADKLINQLVVAADSAGAVPFVEAGRVLCPNGVLVVERTHALGVEEFSTQLRGSGLKVVDAKSSGSEGWLHAVKVRPAGMDVWTHVDHGPGRNRVSGDSLVDLPSGLRWVAAPEWSDEPVIGTLSAHGRLYCVTAGPKTQVQRLVARDAFNGLFLWSRQWERPASHNERRMSRWPMVADDRHVYFLSENELLAVDAASGKTLERFDTDGATLHPSNRLALLDGVLLLSATEGLTAFRTSDARRLWSTQGRLRDVSAGDGRVFFVNDGSESSDTDRSSLTCLNLNTGRAVWKRELSLRREQKIDRRGQRSLRHPLDLCFHADGHLVLGGNLSPTETLVRVVAATDGTTISEWRTLRIRSDQLFFREGSVFVPPSIVADPETKRVAPARIVDAQTGTIVRLLPAGRFGSSTCQLPVCTPRFAFSPKTSITSLDFETGRISASPLATGGCLTGMTPANGLLYNTLQSGCQCNLAALRGITAFERSAPVENSAPQRQKGPAFGSRLSSDDSADDDWPTFRRDSARSNHSPHAIPELSLIWRASVSVAASRVDAPIHGHVPVESISAPVVYGNQVILAEPDAQRVIALDAQTGRQRWTFTANGRVDSPPTMHRGLCLFGCRDGWLYCLRADDGKLNWRLRLAWHDRRIMSLGQLESPWPLHGSVLIHGGLVYATAGRSSGAEGGIRVCVVNPETGHVVRDTTLGRETSVSIMNDVLVSDGDFVYLREWQIDPETGTARQVMRPRQIRGYPGEVRVPRSMENGPVPPIYLHSSWINTLLDGSWRYAFRSYHKGNQRRGFGASFGQLLTFDAKTVYGFRTGLWSLGRRSVPHLFAARRGLSTTDDANPTGYDAASRWTQPLPAGGWVEAMLVAGDTLFVSGPVNPADRSTTGGFLRAHSAIDGKPATDIALASPPQLDGMAAAGDRLYLSLASGDVLCFGTSRP
jgi:outer membrane protein assembly factor BamB